MNLRPDAVCNDPHRTPDRGPARGEPPDQGAMYRRCSRILAMFDPAPSLESKIHRRRDVRKGQDNQRQVKHAVEGQRGFLVEQFAQAVAAIHDVTGQQKGHQQRQQQPAAPADHLDANKVDFAHITAFR